MRKIDVGIEQDQQQANLILIKQKNSSPSNRDKTIGKYSCDKMYPSKGYFKGICKASNDVNSFTRENNNQHVKIKN